MTQTSTGRSKLRSVDECVAEIRTAMTDGTLGPQIGYAFAAAHGMIKGYLRHARGLSDREILAQIDRITEALDRIIDR